MRAFGKAVQWFAVGYFIVVVAIAVFVYIAVNQPGQGASFAGIYLIIATMPLSLLTSMLPVYGLAAVLAYTGTGLVQALIVWGVGRALRQV